MNQQTTQTGPARAADGLSLRPILVLGLGGTGHRIAVWLKALAWQSWGRERTEHRVKFLVFDTAQEALAVHLGEQTVSLEPGSEFVDIGQTPVANIKRNLSRQTAIQERLGSHMASLPPIVLRNGAKQLRPLGLLAWLWRYREVEARLREAIWSLAGRQRDEGREGINVLIVNSLVGGTGSSTFLDMAHLTRYLVDELGNLADSCYVTGVGLLPRAFQGVSGPNLIPNAVASLKELNHCMLRGNFTARYPDGRIISTTQPPFNIYYLVDGVDERGHTWHGPHEVCRLAAEALFLQMGSQVGQKQENDFDNLDEVLVRQTEEGDGTFYGSFGLAALVFSGPAVARACAARQAIRVIEQGLLAAVEDSGEVEQTIADLVALAGLEPGRLVEQLACDDGGTPLSVEMSVPGWASRLSPAMAPGELVRYAREYERVRLGADFKRWLEQNREQLAGAAETVLAGQVTRLARGAGLPTTETFLTSLLAWLEATATELSARQVEREGQIAGLARELPHLETVFLQAGEGLFLGRGQRVARAQQSYFTTAQRLYSLRWQVQVTAAALAVLNRVNQAARAYLAACQAVTTRLQAVRRALHQAGNEVADGLEIAGVTTHTLADKTLVARLFERYAPPPADTLAGLFSGQVSPLSWPDAPVEAIRQALLAASEPAFAPIAALSVEDAITLRSDVATPEGYYNWLIDQATPSWSLDRARLADGGAGLQRLEVLGVPDETSSIYRRHATMLVSTGDRSRLIVFVAHVGAAHTAIQQWDSYLAAYEQARRSVPLHILPQFQTGNERARQVFALGLLFQFIITEGAHFYYKPADRLVRPVKLAQGLANALRVFINQDDLVREVEDRVEQWVASRGVEAALRRLTAYYEAPNGRDRATDGTLKPGDELALELKRLVRAYADELRQIHQFTADSWSDEAETGTRPTGSTGEPEVQHGR